MSTAQVAVSLTVVDPPFSAGHGVLFGLQAGREVDDPVPAHATTEFHTEIEVRATLDGIDFAGPHVNGRRGERFIYLVWGVPDQTLPFVMFARAKIRLDTIPGDVLERSIEQGQRLVAVLQATDRRGQPATGTIKPPAIHWALG